MTRFQLVFRSTDGEMKEYRYNDADHPHIGGRPIVEGEVYTIRGTQWLVRADSALVDTPSFICVPADN